MSTRGAVAWAMLAAIAAWIAVPVLTATGASAVPGSPPAVSPSPRRPAEILGVRPVPGSRVCQRPQIAVDFIVTESMLSAAGLDIARLELRLDGRDVTGQAKVGGTLTHPARRAFLVYTPGVRLRVGVHRVNFTYPLGAQRKTYAWSFTVAAIPCR